MTSSASTPSICQAGASPRPVLRRGAARLRAEIVGMGGRFALYCAYIFARRSPRGVEYAWQIVALWSARRRRSMLSTRRSRRVARRRVAQVGQRWNARTGTTTRQPAAAFFSKELISDKIRRQAESLAPALCQNSSGPPSARLAVLKIFNKCSRDFSLRSCLPSHCRRFTAAPQARTGVHRDPPARALGRFLSDSPGVASPRSRIQTPAGDARDGSR